MNISHLRLQKQCFMPPSLTDITLSFINNQCFIKQKASNLRGLETSKEITLDINHPQVIGILQAIHLLNVSFTEMQGFNVMDGETITLTIESGDTRVRFSWPGGHLTQAWQSLEDICNMIETLIKETKFQ